MHRFSANYIFPIGKPPIKNGVVVLDNEGTVVELIDPKGNEVELEAMEFYNGIIVPGFINTHCHLELSHLKGKLKRATGIAGFVSQIRNLRGVTSDEIAKSIQRALNDERNNGIVAIGDICNTLDTIESKRKSDILFHNFIEQFGLSRENAFGRFSQSKELLNQFQTLTANISSITPHSTYSISDKLWELIKMEITNHKSIVSIHYGESKEEYLLLKDHSGPFAESFNELGIPINLPDCKSPSEIVKRYIPKESNVLFIHNTFALKEEIQQLAAYFKETYFVLCPSSNQFVEESLPDVKMISELGVNIAIGTDSYASSDTLSIFDQMMILQKNFSKLSFDVILKWATYNGAKALNFESKVGSIEVGKKPGLNLITNFDFTNMKPTEKSRVKRLV